MASKASASSHCFPDTAGYLKVLENYKTTPGNELARNLKDLGERVLELAYKAFCDIGVCKIYTLDAERGIGHFPKEVLDTRYAAACREIDEKRAQMQALAVTIIPLFRAVVAHVAPTLTISEAGISKMRTLKGEAETSQFQESLEEVKALWSQVQRLSKKLEVLSRVAEDRLGDVDNHLDTIHAHVVPSVFATLASYRVTKVFGSDPYKVRAIHSAPVSEPQTETASGTMSKRLPSSALAKITLEDVEGEFRARLPTETIPEPRSQLTATEVHTYLVRLHLWVFKRGAESGKALVDDLKPLGAPINLCHYVTALARAGVFSEKTDDDRRDFDVWTAEKKELVEGTDRVLVNLDRLIALFKQGIGYMDIGAFSEADTTAVSALKADSSSVKTSENQLNVDEMKHVLERYIRLRELYTERRANLEEKWRQVEALRKGLDPVQEVVVATTTA